MIKGISLSEKPCMKGITLSRILASLDLLRDFSDPIISEGYEVGSEMTCRQYYSKEFLITVFETNYSRGYEAVWVLLDILQEALPDYLVCFRYTPTQIIYSIPNYYSRVNSTEGLIYENLMDELFRVAVFLVKIFMRDRRGEIIELLRDYVSISVVINNSKDE